MHIEGVDSIETNALAEQLSTIQALHITSLVLALTSIPIDFSNAFCQTVVAEGIYDEILKTLVIPKLTKSLHATK